MLSIAGFTRLATTYQRFALGQIGGDKFLDQLFEAVKSCGVSDQVMEQALAKASATNHMIDIERAKELFHSRLRALSRSGMLPDRVDPDLLFGQGPSMKPGR